MELLKIEHEDFTLSIECTRYNDVWTKAKQHVGEQNLTSTYSWTEGVQSVKRYLDDGGELEISPHDKFAPAIFFDNTDYPIWGEFDSRVTNVRFASILQSDNERFNYHKSRHILAGFINFGNDIGRSELKIKYDVAGKEHTFVFSFDVLSTKLNYHAHWRSIIADIEREYSMLSLDYMRRTFHSFASDSEGESSDLVWWSIFQAQEERFLTAVRYIIERPRHRLRSETTYQRLDKIKRVPNTLENEIAEHRLEEGRLYQVAKHVHSNDTQENRFLKFALAEIAKKYDALKRKIEALENSSAALREEMSNTKSLMQSLQRHPFFRSVGPFQGFSQGNLVLQKATGYTDVYSTWILLRRAYSLYEGLFHLQSKDIATLYEIWCFIKISHIIKEQLGISAEDVDHRNRMEMGGLFTWDLGKGERSRILFRRNGIELAELIYNPKYSQRENEAASVGNFVVKTVAQKPDIVLQLVKDDIHAGMKMTYLFDAKYRIESSGCDVDYPPDDAINQMHRYRDAIYYKKDQDAPLRKEIIGGYILFPGNGDTLDVQASSFYRAIQEVNIGAFPLRPEDADNRKLLSDFIHTLITRDGQTLIEGSIPQKGLNYIIDSKGGDSDFVFVGYVREPKKREPQSYWDYYNTFKDNTQPTFYYTGQCITTTDVDLRSVKYLFTNLPGNGYYRIKRIYSALRKDLFEDSETNQEDSSMRIVFELGEFVPLGDSRLIMSFKPNSAKLHISAKGEFKSLLDLKNSYNDLILREKSK